MGNTLAFKILIGGLRSYVDNFRFFFKTSVPWLFFFLPAYWFGKDYVVAHHPYFDNSESIDSLSMLINILLPMLLTVPFASIAVSWHRHILIGTPAPFLTMDYAVWRYWWNGILIVLMAAAIATPAGLIPLLPFVFSSIPQGLVDVLWFVEVVAPAVTYVVVFLIMYRLSIKLPALAIGRISYGFKESWNDTKGQKWEFVILGTIMTFLGILVVKIERGIDEQLPQIDSLLAYIGLISVEPLAELIFTGFGISILTYSYAYFAEKREL